MYYIYMALVESQRDALLESSAGCSAVPSLSRGDISLRVRLMASLHAFVRSDALLQSPPKSILVPSANLEMTSPTLS